MLYLKPPRLTGVSFGLLFGLLASPGIDAQTTWVVDASGGPGSNFAQIQPALNAAADGDTILVRAGSYPEFALSTAKGVMIAGEPGVVVGTVGGVGFTLSKLRAGKTFVMRNLSFTVGATRLQFTDCAGQVYLEEVDMSQATVSNSFVVENCAQVCMTQVTASGLPAMIVSDSNVVLVDCRISAVPWATSYPALTLTNSELTIVDSTLTGGSSAIFTPAPAIQMGSGTLTLAGRSTSVSAGTSPLPSPTSAVHATTGQVFVDPAVVLVSQGGAATIAGGATVATGPVASVHADGLRSLGTWQLDLHAPTGSAFCLFVSLPLPAVVSPWGPVWLDLNAYAVLACGTVGAGNQFAMSLPLPILPRAVPLVAQAGVATPAGLLQFSTPSVDIIE